MLPRHADDGLHAGFRFETFDERRHLDGFGPRTESRQDSHRQVSGELACPGAAALPACDAPPLPTVFMPLPPAPCRAA
jgi:hypothetical protein